MSARIANVLEKAQILRKISIGRNMEHANSKLESILLTSSRLQTQVKVRRVKAKAKANPKAKGMVKTKVRRRKNLMQRRVWIRSEQPQLEGAMVHFQETA